MNMIKSTPCHASCLPSNCVGGILMGILLTIMMMCPSAAYAESIDLGARSSGLSIGNSSTWTGVRIKMSDRGVDTVRGVNITFLPAHDNKDARISGVSVGLYGPSGGTLTGLQIGGVGVMAQESVRGVSLGFLGTGAGEDVSGLAFGGLGAGAGESITGIAFGTLGAGAGEHITGIAFGGLGAGAGESITGIAFGGLGVGAGESINGIAVGMLGAGAGEVIKGIVIGGLGAGAGESITGFSLGILAVGAGEDLKGVAVGGLGVGAGESITGIAIALGTVKISKDGRLKGFSASTFNHIRGSQTGLSIGIVNIAYELNGVQIGLVNYVRENPPYRRLLPLVNFNLK